VKVHGRALDPYPGTDVPDPAAGAYAPELTGKDFAGKPVRIGSEVDANGKKKVVLFVAHWCPDCDTVVHSIASWQRGHSLPANAALYLVVTGTDRRHVNYPPSAWLAGAGLGQVPTLLDSAKGDAARAYGLTALPSFPYWVFLDEASDVMGRLKGALSQDAFGAVVATLASGAKVSIGADGIPGGGRSATTTEETTPTTLQATPTTSEEATPTTQEAAPTTAPPASGLDWRSILGKPFEDPEVTALAKSCGPGSENSSPIAGPLVIQPGGNIVCKAKGFELVLGDHLQVVAVDLYNAEQDGFNQFAGSLPFGLTWSDDYQGVESRLGTPDTVYGGNGLEVESIYDNHDSYSVKITWTATHKAPEDLAAARMHSIELRQA